MTEHDRIAKELLTACFPEFIELFFPELGGYLDRRSISFLDKEVFSDAAAGATHVADLVAKAKCRDQESCFLIHLEHQAQPQAEFASRMFTYFAALRARHHLPIYPIALFSHGSVLPEPNEYRVEFPDLSVLHFRFRVVQLSRLNWQDFVQKANPVASALMARMAIAPQERPSVKLECLRMLVDLRLDPARVRLISGFIDTYLRLDAEEELLFKQQAATLLGETEKTRIMELTTSWKEEGIQIGREEGRKEGREEGREQECQLILRLLRKRVGLVDADCEARISQFSFALLGELGEALVDFSSPLDLKKWLAVHI
jgi:hypothetical protein